MRIDEQSSKNSKAGWLDQKEADLQAALSQGDMPLLGLYVDSFSPDARHFMREHVIDHRWPVGSFLNGLNHWPATFATYLTVHIVEGYGTHGSAKVYPYVADCLRLDPADLSPQDRENLAKAYRRACIRLGLSVAPPGQSTRVFVDEYLRQAGVPIAYLRGLFQGFAHLTATVGVPDPEYPEELRAWESQVAIPPTRPVLQRAVNNDDSGYYAGLFIRVRDFQAASECTSSIERAAFDALQGLTRGAKHHRALIPELNWRDDQLGVLLPAGDDRQWSIRIQDPQSVSSILPSIQGDRDPRFIALPSGLPMHCDVASGSLDFHFSIWDTADNNRVLVFNRSGRLIGKSALGGDAISLNPGSYTLVSRWKPEELGDLPYPVASDVSLFAAPLDLVADQSILLRRGPATLKLVARNVPSLNWIGERLVGITGREIYWGADIAVRINLPRELVESAQHGFELVVTVSGGARRLVPVPASADAFVDIGIMPALNDLGGCLDRVLIKLRRPDIPNRSIATISGFVWPGLQRATVGRFSVQNAGALSNLDPKLSDNVQITESCVTYSDATQRFFRTVFELQSGDQVAFGWPVPGIFLALDEIRDGQAFEKLLSKGDAVQVRPSSRQRLKIYSDTPGTIQLGNFRQELMSALLGGTVIHLSSLAEFISPEDDTLRLRLPGAAHAIDLLRMVTPHQALSFDSARSSDEYSLNFKVLGTLEAIDITATDLLTGATDRLPLIADNVNVTGDTLGKVSLLTEAADRASIAYLSFSLADWSDGVWLIHFQAKIDGRWGRLVNARGDVFAGLLRRPQNAFVAQYLPDLAPERLMEIFGRLVNVLLECYAPESWKDLESTLRDWSVTANEAAKYLDVFAQRLLAISLRHAPDTSAQSWVPVVSVAGYLTEIFGLPMNAYRNFSGSTNTTNLVLGSGRLAAQNDDDLFSDAFLDIYLIFGFKNGAAVARHASHALSGFSLDEYSKIGQYVGHAERRRILASSEWAPAPGHLLGVRHYWWALNRLQQSLTVTQVANHFRRGHLIRLSRRLSIVGASGVHPTLAALCPTNRLSLGEMTPSDTTEDSAQQTDNLQAAIDLVSTLALAARMHARQPGLLLEVKKSLATHAELDATHMNAVLGFLLYIGIDLFIFYLGLWEFVLARDYDRGV